VGLGLRQKWRKIRIKRNFKRKLKAFIDDLERGRHSSSVSEPKATAILLSYARPQNIQPICQALLKCDFIEKVVVSNNNPDMSLDKWLQIEDSRIEIQNQSTRRRAGFRYEIARKLEAENFVFIDDDLFLTPDQISYVYGKLLENPVQPQGVWGQTFRQDATGEVEITNGKRGIDDTVDVINRAYFLTREHVSRFLGALRYLGLESVLDLKFGDDLILSMSAAEKPFCHNVGQILECYSANDEGVAIWTEGSFDNYRIDLYRKMLEYDSA
jgi:hypothetical protein